VPRRAAARRKHLAPSFSVPLEQIAFCQPTANGRALAAAYTGCERFLVYVDAEDGDAPSGDGAPADGPSPAHARAGDGGAAGAEPRREPPPAASPG